MDCGVETVHDLIDHVRRREGLTALSEQSQIPIEHLRSYLHLAEEESSKARARRTGSLWLVAIAILTAVLAGFSVPESMTAEEANYDAFHTRYLDDDQDPGLVAELDSIVVLYDSVRNGGTSPADSDRARRLDTWVGGAAVLGDGTTMSPQLANLVSLRAAMSHDAQLRAAAVGNSDEYESLVQKTQKLDALLEGTESHREYAIENSRRTLTESSSARLLELDRQAAARLLELDRQTEARLLALDRAAEARLLESVAELINTKVAEMDSKFAELAESLARQSASLRTAIADSRALTARRLDRVDASIDAILTLLSDPPLPPVGIVGPTPDEKPTPLRARSVILDHWPPALRDQGSGGTVEVQLYIDAEGRVQDSGERAPQVITSSGSALLDEAAVSAALEIEWNPAKADGNPVPVSITWEITFGPAPE